VITIHWQKCRSPSIHLAGMMLPISIFFAFYLADSKIFRTFAAYKSAQVAGDVKISM
jgi:hypothetical protein